VLCVSAVVVGSRWQAEASRSDCKVFVSQDLTSLTRSVIIRDMQTTTYERIRVKGERAPVILRAPRTVDVDGGRLLVGVHVDREGREVAPRGVDERIRVIDLTLVSCRTPMVWNLHYGELEVAKGPSNSARCSEQPRKRLLRVKPWKPRCEVPARQERRSGTSRKPQGCRTKPCGASPVS